MAGAGVAGRLTTPARAARSAREMPAVAARGCRRPAVQDALGHRPRDERRVGRDVAGRRCRPAPRAHSRSGGRSARRPSGPGARPAGRGCGRAGSGAGSSNSSVDQGLEPIRGRRRRASPPPSRLVGQGTPSGCGGSGTSELRSPAGTLLREGFAGRRATLDRCSRPGTSASRQVARPCSTACRSRCAPVTRSAWSAATAPARPPCSRSWAAPVRPPAASCTTPAGSATCRRTPASTACPTT